MARIAKSGLEYFPFDIDLFQDLRIRKLIKRQGGKAVTVYALLLCLIYKNGYYMQWDEELPFIGSEMSGFDEAYVSEVIKTCLTLGLFDKKLFDTEQVLTSKGIQVRYCNIQRLNKRMSRIDQYSLIEEETEPYKVSKKVSLQKSLPKAKPDPTLKADYSSFDGEIEQIKADKIWCEPVCMQFHIDKQELDRRLVAFGTHCKVERDNELHSSLKDAKRHFTSWMRKAYNSHKGQPAADSNTTDDYSFQGGFGGLDN